MWLLGLARHESGLFPRNVMYPVVERERQEFIKSKNGPVTQQEGGQSEVATG